MTARKSNENTETYQQAYDACQESIYKEYPDPPTIPQIHSFFILAFVVSSLLLAFGFFGPLFVALRRSTKSSSSSPRCLHFYQEYCSVRTWWPMTFVLFLGYCYMLAGLVVVIDIHKRTSNLSEIAQVVIQPVLTVAIALNSLGQRTIKDAEFPGGFDVRNAGWFSSYPEILVEAACSSVISAKKKQLEMEEGSRAAVV
jgi:hypothetical protein